MTEKLAYSIDEAATALSLSRSAVKEEIYQGRIEFKRVGRRVLIPKWSLENYLSKTESLTGESQHWESVLKRI